MIHEYAFNCNDLIEIDVMSSKKKPRGSNRSAWMQEHLDDPYVQQANVEGWRSRAVYKLQEIDKKDRLIRPGMRIVDLGSAPGGWSQYAARKLNGKGQVIATDILPMDSLPDVTFIQGDFTEQSVFDDLMATLQGEAADLVLSDMAPNMSGMKAMDQPRSMYLVELALDLATQVLTADGIFLTKVFQGEGFEALMKELRGRFVSVSSRKPAASRARSREIYLLAKGIREG
jgi:23S rRNA (uridine2552-2'-O)-methyltransferase